ncbi:hypothetical protein [Burkholderia sp. LMG 21824]|uniref:hypothetical protein n=1 Tax=Burkholderia sp. LMG 21824 TaxID=3158172 RepID=UPI003C2E4027
MFIDPNRVPEKSNPKFAYHDERIKQARAVFHDLEREEEKLSARFPTTYDGLTIMGIGTIALPARFPSALGAAPSIVSRDAGNSYRFTLRHSQPWRNQSLHEANRWKDEVSPC